MFNASFNSRRFLPRVPPVAHLLRVINTVARSCVTVQDSLPQPCLVHTKEHLRTVSLVLYLHFPRWAHEVNVLVKCASSCEVYSLIRVHLLLQEYHFYELHAPGIMFLLKTEAL